MAGFVSGYNIMIGCEMIDGANKSSFTEGAFRLELEAIEAF